MFREEYKDGKSNRREYRCRACDGPLELAFQLVCDECDRRDTEEMEREQEFYSAWPGIEEPGYRELVEEKELVAANAGGAKESPGAKRKGYKM